MNILADVFYSVNTSLQTQFMANDNFINLNTILHLNMLIPSAQYVYSCVNGRTLQYCACVHAVLEENISAALPFFSICVRKYK